jgi:hypothetical protein
MEKLKQGGMINGRNNQRKGREAEKDGGSDSGLN